jgi:hypothetical protein
MPKCKKCGESLHPEQKVCIVCGTQTDLWPSGPQEEKKKPVEIPWRIVGPIAGGLLIAIVIVVLGLHIRIVPPNTVTRKWLDAVTSRDINRAKQYTLPEFEATILDQPASAEKSDDYYRFMYDNNASYSVSKPEYDSPQSPTSAVVTMTFTGTNGQVLVERARLVLKGKAWKIAAVEE